ncbi:MFS transporter [Demequina globuliformis]|uniref:MFS transporter n=1 Tax=Demequina globuliformis TaxID=676202 RepID=UPI000780675F|nr:MFS transporter [Demequina globuliformis]
MSETGLGRNFSTLFTAAISSNLADGIGRLAIPLTAVALTTNPMAIGLLTALVYVPWLFFGVPAGMLVDRMDRRHAMALANVVRMVTAAGVAVSIATGTVSIAVLALATVVLGLGETLFDNATNAMVPSVVRRPQLGSANGRIQAAQVGVDMFVATPVSGLLYAVAVALPMVVSSAGYVVAVVLVLVLPVAVARPRVEPGDSADPISLREAMRFLWNHRYLRAITIVTSAVGACIALAQSVTILLFVEQFGVPDAAMGFVTAGIGVGGLTGALTAGRVMRRWGYGRTLVAGSLLGAVGLIVVGLAPYLWLAMVGYAISAYGISSWNVPWATLRQVLTPDRIMGRVIGAIRTVTWSMMPVATLVGAWSAKAGLQVPFIVGGVGALVVTVGAATLLLRADAQVEGATAAEAAAAAVRQAGLADDAGEAEDGGPRETAAGAGAGPAEDAPKEPSPVPR